MPDYLIPLPAADTLFGAAAEEFPEIAKTPQQKNDYAEIKRDLRLDPTEDLKDLTLTGFDDAQTKLKLDHADAEYNDRFATMMGTIEGWLHTKQDVDRKWGLIADEILALDRAHEGILHSIALALQLQQDTVKFSASNVMLDFASLSVGLLSNYSKASPVGAVGQLILFTYRSSMGSAEGTRTICIYPTPMRFFCKKARSRNS